MLNELKQGIINTKLFKRENLETIIDDLRYQIKYLKIPIPQEYLNIEKIIRISTFDVVTISNRIDVSLKFLLVDVLNYRKYKIHRLHSNVYNNKNIKSLSIKPYHQYIVISEDEERYLKLSEEELEKL